MRRRSVAFATAALTAFLLGAAAAHRPKPPPCPGGRFLVEGQPLLAGDPTLEAIVIDGGSAAIGSACPLVSVRLQGSARRTVVRGNWPAGVCAGVSGRVRLRATITDGCALLRGTLIAARRARRLEAPLSTCGDGVVDPGAGEQCDGSTGCAAGQTCVACACTPATRPSTTSTTATTSTTVPGCGAPLAPCASGAACCSTLCQATSHTCTCVDPAGACTADVQCCNGGVCASGNCCLLPGTSCEDASDCCSGTCSGQCQ